MDAALNTGTMSPDVLKSMLQDVLGGPKEQSANEASGNQYADVTSKNVDSSGLASLKEIFTEMAYNIESIARNTFDTQEFLSAMVPSERDQGIDDADVKPPTDDAPPEDTGGKGFGLEMPKIGPKTGLALMLIALTALFKYGDEIKAGIEKVLPFITGFIDLIGPQGALYLGLAGLAALIFPKTFKTLLGVGAKSIKFAFGLLKTGFTTMKDAITSMPGLIKGAYSKGKELLGGAFGLLKEGFNTLKGFITDKMIPGITNAAGKGKDGIMFVVNKIKGAFMALRLFMIDTMIPAIKNAAGGVGGKLMKAVGLLTAAFTALKVFLLSTMIPAIAAIAAPIAIPLALVVAGVAAAVAIFYAIKDGIQAFKDSLAEGDSMLVAIIEGVTTALLTLVTLPITLIKNFVAWVAKKLGFEGIAEKLKEFNIVTFIKDGIKTLVLKAKDFVLGLFNIDFKKVLGKFIDIGKSIGRVLKAIALGAIAAVKAAFPGGESPMEAFKRVYDEVSNQGNDNPQMPKEADPEADTTVKTMEQVRKEEIKANEAEIDELESMDEDTLLADGNTAESKIYELEERNGDLLSMIYESSMIQTDIAKKALELQEKNSGGNVVTTINNTDASNTNNSSSNTTNTGGLSVEGKDSTARLLTASGYGEF